MTKQLIGGLNVWQDQNGEQTQVSETRPTENDSKWYPLPEESRIGVGTFIPYTEYNDWTRWANRIMARVAEERLEDAQHEV